MDSYLFVQWIEKVIAILKKKKILCLTKRNLLITDGHKIHVTLEVIIKAKENGVDLITLPNCTSHKL